MLEKTISDPRYQVQRTCSTCRGQGHIILENCPECGESLTTEVDWWLEESLPCGHEAAAIQLDCESCKGHGSILYTLTEEEYQQLRLKKLIRGIFLLILGLLPFILLLIAIFARDPKLLFGAPWY